MEAAFGDAGSEDRRRENSGTAANVPEAETEAEAAVQTGCEDGGPLAPEPYEGAADCTACGSGESRRTESAACETTTCTGVGGRLEGWRLQWKEAPDPRLRQRAQRQVQAKSRSSVQRTLVNAAECTEATGANSTDGDTKPGANDGEGLTNSDADAEGADSTDDAEDTSAGRAFARLLGLGRIIGIKRAGRRPAGARNAGRREGADAGTGMDAAVWTSAAREGSATGGTGSEGGNGALG